jgi:hypothetical protein
METMSRRRPARCPRAVGGQVRRIASWRSAAPYFWATAWYVYLQTTPAAPVYQDSYAHEFDTGQGAPVQSGYDG